MTNIPIRRSKNEVQPASDSNGQALTPYGGNNSFFSFKYSSKSMTLADGKTHIQAKTARFENGKLETLEFEGVTDENMYHKAANDMHQRMVQEMNSVFRQFSSFFNAIPLFPKFPEK
jgi:hypothetical protein